VNSKTNTPPELTGITGRYEVTMQQFNDALKDEPRESILQFDLKKAFPDALASGTRLPKVSEKIWRRVLDENIAEYGGAYCHDKTSTFVQLWLENLPIGVARARLDTIAARMADIKKRAAELGPEGDVETLFTVAVKDTRVTQLSPNTIKLMQHGLPANPPADLFDLWVQRTTQAIIHAEQKTPFLKDIMEVVSKAELGFMPVWTCANELLVGSFGYVRNPAGTHSSAEPIRQDLLAMFATMMQLTMLASKKINAIGFLSVRQNLLASKTAMDLLFAFLHVVSPDIKKNIIIELKGMPKGEASPTVKAMIETLGANCKTYMLETGVFSKDEVFRDVPKLHAVGFDLQGLVLPEVEISSLIRKYSEIHKKHGHKLYIKGITAPYHIKLAKECGYTYLSGAAVHAPEKFMNGVRQFPIRL